LISLLATWPLAYGQAAAAFSTQEERFAERKVQMKNVEFYGRFWEDHLNANWTTLFHR
jgi:hypothetical protein